MDTESETNIHEDIKVSMTLPDETIVTQPYQLLSKEKVLLVACVREFRKRGGQVDWDKVEEVFETNADDCHIFKRQRRRLQSSMKKLHTGLNGPTDSIRSLDDTIGPTHDSQIEENLLLVGGRQEESDIDTDDVVENESIEAINSSRNSSSSIGSSSSSSGSSSGSSSSSSSSKAGNGMLSSSVTHTHITQSVEQQRKDGQLDDNEREFVKNYGKKCLLAKKNIDNSHMSKQYKAAFPGFFRDGDILKRFWNNWKKDSTAYRQFLDSVKNK